MYIKTLDDAIAAVAEVLDLPEHRDRIIQCTIKIMLCLEPGPREFLADSQALLLEGGLDQLRQRRRELIAALEEDQTVAILSPEEDRLFESVGSAVDALQLCEVAFRVFPGLESSQEKWRVARALRRNEAGFDRIVSQGIRVREHPERHRDAMRSLEKLVRDEAPEWSSRAAEMREACRQLFADGSTGSARPEDDADELFSVFGVDDERAAGLLAAIDRGPEEEQELLRQTYDCLAALHSLDQK